jgi:predicted enzyme related to lactoylglutathione lyase
MPRPIHFEIQADNPERAIAFYKAVFDWQFNQWGTEKYWLVMTGDKAQPGIDGGLMPRPQPGAPQMMAPVNAFVCTTGVDDVDAYAAKATKAGGTIVVPKMAVPTVGWLVYCKDTEGNIFGMIQMDANAK